MHQSLRKDLLAGSVVFIIAVPLSLGIAMASGMPPVAALITAMIGGVIAGTLSGAPLVVSGPAAGLSALILENIHTYGIDAVFRITIIAGIIQIIFALLQLGRHISKIPKPLLEGVLSAIGLTILLGQVHILMGHAIPGNAVANLLHLPETFFGTFGNGFWIAPAFVCGLLAMFVQIIWPKFFKRVSWLPGALPATLIGTLVSLLWYDDVKRVVLDAVLPHVMEKTSLLALKISLDDWTPLLFPAFGLALVASAESLLTARAIDVLATIKQIKIKTNMEKELMAQGIGNLLSGLLGGMPMTGVMVRSAANIDAGATNRASTITHGFLVGITVFAFPKIMELIPLSVLASILVLTGWKLLNLKSLLQAIRYRPKETYLWPITIVAIISTDLLKGFGFGIAVWLLTSLLPKSNHNSSTQNGVVEATNS